MDYLNPKKRRNHLIRLFTGYVLVASLVVIVVIIFFYLVIGYTYKDGVVVQNGMLFVSSTPRGARIDLNGQASGTTNKRMIVAAGKYDITLKSDGYRPWQRTVVLRGGKVQRYNYPLLIPNQLISSSVTNIDGRVGLATESPDNHWLLINDPASLLKFNLIDLSNPAQPKVSSFALPDNILSSGVKQSWQVVEWADDSQHVLLRHNFDNKYEFVVVDTQNPAKSVNLNADFGASPTDIRLFNQAYNQYWFLSGKTHELSRADLSDNKITPYLAHVLAFKGYSDSIVLYATATNGGHAKIVWYQNGQDYVLANNLPLSKAASDYLLDLAQYQNDWYAVIGETASHNVTVYKNPLASINNHPDKTPPIAYILKIDHPSYEKFSANAQFIMAENGTDIAVYNALYHTGYSYKIGRLDSPQKHMAWMDGYHLLHIAGGQLVISDFNNINQQTLVATSPDYQSFFSSNYDYLFTLQVSTNGGKSTTSLSSTPLRLPADL